MAYITRDDGERFVIPSYRDVLTTKQKSQLKRDILLLSQSYGEYITLQKKSQMQYEVAFSPDQGYLLGESVWHYFKRPLDMIYCEAIPNTMEALLVIVKAGSVYLDGTFPFESIPEELVIFLTQQNNFEIYVYGDVPIGQHEDEGKFSFDATSVKSFTVLDKPVFPTLPLLKMYQLQLVDVVLKAQGIGVFPTRQVVMGIILVGFLWLLWTLWSSYRAAPVVAPPPPNPYEGYISELSTPAPNEEINQLLNGLNVLLTMPGWVVNRVSYANGSLTVLVQSIGGKTEDLMSWAKSNNVGFSLKPDGIYLTLPVKVARRSLPKNIYPLNAVIANFVDRLNTVYPGNHLKLGTFTNQGPYTTVVITINVASLSPMLLALIGEQFKDLPFSLQNVALNAEKDGTLTGSIIIEVLGSPQ